MLAPEYRVGFRVLREKIGSWATLRCAIPAFLKASMVRHRVDRACDDPELIKADLKDHFQLLASLYHLLEKRYGEVRTGEIMREVLLEGGYVFFRGFTRLGPGEKLREFVEIYKVFEHNNIIFDVIEETDKRFEIEVTRCLVFEAFHELGIAMLTQWMCDIAFEYFSRYHPQMTYEKDRMIARGAATCHEVFIWHEALVTKNDA